MQSHGLWFEDASLRQFKAKTTSRNESFQEVVLLTTIKLTKVTHYAKYSKSVPEVSSFKLGGLDCYDNSIIKENGGNTHFGFQVRLVHGWSLLNSTTEVSNFDFLWELWVRQQSFRVFGVVLPVL